MQIKNTPLRAYLVDDEKPAIVKLEMQLSNVEGVKVIGYSQSPIEAIGEIKELRPDLVFLDINMAELDGFDILPFLPDKTLIIFTTASDQHAITAFENSAVDYLLKPFDTTRLLKALGKVDKYLTHGEDSRDNHLINASNREKLVSKQGDRIFFVNIEDIHYFKSAQGTVHGFTENKVYPFSISLEKLEAELNPQDFVRFHRGYLINVNHVKEVQRWFGGKLLVIMSDSNATEITSSRDGARILKRQFDL